ncbi:GNAT family acetyltransferase yjcF [Vibrio ishigakensis]|uniref:GNAT family acetyltransferase yjcF n=1 Tax=Vibrio ishigakensis TaxID=1481914 RepID=A0A0B8QLZ6_9VIBR|nr:GNAT family acetyltransferase yjcF [Vibrio ishigakensis]
MNIQIEVVDWSREADIRSVRNAVFSEEQGIDSALDFDGQDKDAMHALVIAEGKPVGTGRVLSDGHIGRVCVLKSHRGLGLGRDITKALVESAREQKLSRVYLNSQAHAIDFYKELGFETHGEGHMEVGIPHQAMRLEF